MTSPAYVGSIAFIALALALLMLLGLLTHAGQRRVVAAIGCLAGAAFFIGVVLWALDLAPVPFSALFDALMFSLIATIIAIAVLRAELLHAGQWVVLGIGTLIACVGAQPDLLAGTPAHQGAVLVAGIFVMARAPGLIGRFVASRRHGATSRWWSLDDGYDLLIYLLLIAAMIMPSLSLASLMAGLAALLYAHQTLRRRR
jgi:hypothetical protein